MTGAEVGGEEAGCDWCRGIMTCHEGTTEAKGEVFLLGGLTLQKRVAKK